METELTTQDDDKKLIKESSTLSIDTTPRKNKKWSVVPEGFGESLTPKFGHKPLESSDRIHMKTDVISAMVVKETLRRQNQKVVCMLHPMSSLVTYWTVAAAILLSYISITVPLFLAYDPDLPKSYLTMDVIIDIFFLFDIAVNFRTGYFPNYNRPDLVIMDPQEVSRAYLRSWFPMDLISGIPFVTIGVILFNGDGTSKVPQQELKLLKLARILRLAKLTKLAKVSTFARRLDEAYVDLMVTHPGVVIFLRMMKLVLIGCIIVHYMACGWFMVGSYHSNGWVDTSGASRLGVPDQYLYSTYWVVTTMTTVGYGDISADNGSERAFSIFAMITGCGFYGLLIAQITSIVAESESNRRVIAERVDAIASYVHAKDFHPNLQKQILVYFRNYLKKNSVVDEWQILRDLSSGLRGQVINHLMTSVITGNPFFMHLQHHTAELFHIMHLQVVDRGQHVTRKGQLSRDMMVLLVGSAVILDESEESVKAGQGDPIYPLYEVTPGAIFGERCALGLDEAYNTTVRALTNCELYVIFADELVATLGRRLFNGLRRKCTSDSIFKIRLRTYCIATIPDSTMGMLRKMMLELPSDPNRRTWSRKTNSKTTKSSTSTIDNGDDDDEDDDDHNDVSAKYDSFRTSETKSSSSKSRKSVRKSSAQFLTDKLTAKIGSIREFSGEEGRSSKDEQEGVGGGRDNKQENGKDKHKESLHRHRLKPPSDLTTIDTDTIGDDIKKINKMVDEFDSNSAEEFDLLPSHLNGISNDVISPMDMDDIHVDIAKLTEKVDNLTIKLLNIQESMKQSNDQQCRKMDLLLEMMQNQNQNSSHSLTESNILPPIKGAFEEKE